MVVPERSGVLVSARDLVEVGFAQRASTVAGDVPGWRLQSEGAVGVHEILDETMFFERFAVDISHASTSVFGLAALFRRVPLATSWNPSFGLLSNEEWK